MCNLYLEKPELKHEQQYVEMMNEWETFGGRLNPGALSRYSNRRKENVLFSEWLVWIKEDSNEATCPQGSIPQDLYFLIDNTNKNERIIGVVTIRHYILESLNHNGSNFGYGIRPSERNKGYGKNLLKLALEKAKKDYGFEKVLITVDKENVGSVKVIEANGGMLENIYKEDNGNIMLRYWIRFID